MTQSFLERLNSPTGALFEEVLFEAILAVETSMAFTMHNLDAIGFAEIVQGISPQSVFLVWECNVPKISRGAAGVGLAGLIELLPDHLYPAADKSENLRAALTALEKEATRRQVPASTAILVLAAKKRGLPCESLGGPYLRLGHGSSQRIIYASATESTSFAATHLSRNKHKTNRRLAELRLPVPRHVRVKTLNEALTAAQNVGYPVVVKPVKGKKGGGVSAGIKDPKDIPHAFERALGKGPGVIVESLVRGEDHRLLVIGGQFIAALMRLPPTIEGDGLRTITELIEDLNNDPLRDDFRHFKVAFDDELNRVLEQNGYTLGWVLENGKTLALRSTSNVSTGGMAIDVTDRVHPDNQEMAIQAAAAVGLDVAGIDFMTTDISRSYREIGGSIIEVNARPGLDIHVWPARGTSRDVGTAMLELSFPPGVTGRIPTVVVAGDRGTLRVARDLEAILRACGKTVGVVTRKGAFAGRRAAKIGESQQRKAVRLLFRDPRVEALVSTLSPRRAVSRGLMVDHVDAAAIMQSRSDDDVAVYRQGLEVVIKATSGVLVAGAGNGVALRAMNALDPKRLILVSADARDPVLDAHLASGGIAVVRVGEQGQDRILIRRAGESVALIPVGPTGADETIRARRLEARMFAIGLAFGMGLSGREINGAHKLVNTESTQKVIGGPNVWPVVSARRASRAPSGGSPMTMPELRGALEGLKPLYLSDLARYKAAVTAGQQMGWGYYFPYLLSRKRPGSSMVLWAEDQGSVCLYVWRLLDATPRLDLCVAPTPMDAAVLGRCLERANDFNGDFSARVLRVDAKDVDAVTSLPRLRVKQRRMQYVYAPQSYADLGGRRYYTIRRNVALVEKMPNVEVLPYSASHAESCHALLRRWQENHRRGHGTAGGVGMSRRAIDLAGSLPDTEVKGEVVFVDGRLSAFAFGGEIRPGLGCSFDRKCDPELRGLSYFHFRSFLMSLGEYELVNDGSDTGWAGLRQLKDSFRPVEMHAEYRATQRRQKPLAEIKKDGKTIRVINYKKGMAMRFGKNLYQSYERHDGKLEPLYWSYFALSPLFSGGNVRDMCLLGFGGGVVAKLYHQFFPAITVTGVEIDPDVAKLAKQYFSIPAQTKIVIDDAEHYLQSTYEPFGLILVDLYDDQGSIALVWQPSFLDSTVNRLSDHGVLVVNYLGNEEHYQELVAGLQARFASVYLVPITITAQKNKMLYATKQPRSLDQLKAATSQLEDPKLQELTKPFLQTIEQVR